MQVLRVGSVGSDVMIWQGIIGAKQDGVFGVDTLKATKLWQGTHGIVADGVVGPQTWASTNITMPEVKPLLRGTDLSAIQGATGLTPTVWKQLADSGTTFAIFRLMVGNESWSDVATVRANVTRSMTYGIASTGYMFPYPLPHLDYKIQVERFVRLLEGLGTRVGDLPPAFDIEWPPPEEKDKSTGQIMDTWKKWGCSPLQIREWCLGALEYGEQLTGVKWMVYSYRYFLRRIEVQKSPEFGKYPLWLADYTFKGLWPTPAQIDGLTVPAPWNEITIVQHDGDGGLKLPNGVDADFNVMLGGQEKLEEMIHVTSIVHPPSYALTDDTGDLQVARQQGTALMMDDMIAAYRRNRIDEAA